MNSGNVSHGAHHTTSVIQSVAPAICVQPFSFSSHSQYYSFSSFYSLLYYHTKSIPTSATRSPCGCQFHCITRFCLVRLSVASRLRPLLYGVLSLSLSLSTSTSTSTSSTGPRQFAIMQSTQPGRFPFLQPLCTDHRSLSSQNLLPGVRLSQILWRRVLQPTTTSSR